MPKLELADPSFVDEAPVTINVGRTLHASPEAVWAALTDNESWTEWFPNMKRCDTTSSDPNGIGSTRTVKVGGLVADEQFIFWDRPKDWGFSIVKTNLPLATKMIERVQLESTGGTTNVRYSASFTPHLLTKPIVSLVKMQIMKSWEDGLVGLAQHIE